MAEQYIITIAGNGYAISPYRNDFDSRDNTPMQIASEGDLETQLNVLRVGLKINQHVNTMPANPTAGNAKSVSLATPVKTPRLPPEVVKFLCEHGHNIPPASLMENGKLTVMGHEITHEDLRAAFKP